MEGTNETLEFERKYSGKPIEEVIRDMATMGERKEEAEAQLTAINKEYDYLRMNLVPKLFDNMGVSNMNMPGLGRVGLTSDIYASIQAGMKDEAYVWLDDIGSGDLVSKTVNSSTLKAFLKRRLLSGDDVPDTLFKITPFTRASITRK